MFCWPSDDATDLGGWAQEEPDQRAWEKGRAPGDLCGKGDWAPKRTHGSAGLVREVQGKDKGRLQPEVPGTEVNTHRLPAYSSTRQRVDIRKRLQMLNLSFCFQNG